MKFGVKIPETSRLCCMVQKRFDILNRLRVDHVCDRRTDRQTD